MNQIRSAVSMLTDKPLKMVLVVRTDIRMSKGKTAAQCCHAAIACYQKSTMSAADLLKKWINLGQPKIVLKVDTLAELESLAKSADTLGIVNELIRDAGRTQLEPGTVTILGLGPDYDDRLVNIIKNLKLL